MIRPVSQAETLSGEVKQRWLFPPVGQLDVRVSQLIEERVRTGLERRETSHGSVLQQARTQSDGFRRCAWPEHLQTAHTPQASRSDEWDLLSVLHHPIPTAEKRLVSSEP